MQGKTRIILSQKLVRLITLKKKNSSTYLFDELLDNKELIASLLVQYYNEGAPEINNLNIIEESIELNSKGEGKMYVEYDVFYYWGCAGLNTEDEDYMELTLKLDIKNNILEIIGVETIEREPDRY